VVLLDLTMPEMDGLQMLERLRMGLPDLPVLLSSGYADDTLPLGTLEKGRTGFLRKPYGPARLTQALAELVQSPQEAGSVTP
jgi:two-component system, NtrC family, C4-dicarboxylate transport response regulator DctD